MKLAESSTLLGNRLVVDMLPTRLHGPGAHETQIARGRAGHGVKATVLLLIPASALPSWMVEGDSAWARVVSVYVVPRVSTAHLTHF